MNNSDFLIHYSEFAELEQNKITKELVIATKRVELEATDSEWGTLKSVAIAALCAHGLAIQYHEQLSLGGALTAIDLGKVPNLNRPTDIPYLNLTSYGKYYYDLLLLVQGKKKIKKFPTLFVIDPNEAIQSEREKETLEELVNIKAELQALRDEIDSLATGGPTDPNTQRLYVHQQILPSLVWDILHNQNIMKPDVQVFDHQQNQVLCTTILIDTNQVRLVFTTPTRGTAYLC